jgi:hypothetical protein
MSEAPAYEAVQKLAFKPFERKRQLQRRGLRVFVAVRAARLRHLWKRRTSCWQWIRRGGCASLVNGERCCCGSLMAVE